MRLLIRSILRRARSRVSLCVYGRVRDGNEEGCSTTGSFTSTYEGLVGPMILTMSTETRIAIWGGKRVYNIQRFKFIYNHAASTSDGDAERTRLISTFCGYSLLTHLLNSPLHAMIHNQPGFVVNIVVLLQSTLDQ
jgi:hypothetical protein